MGKTSGEKKLETLEELVSFLLYKETAPDGQRVIIAVGLIYDEDIADEMSPELLLRVTRLLK